MGSFNKAAPFDETRYTTIPAQPGWFVFEWEGSRTDYTMRKAPIVAWLVETEFYPETRTGSERLTGRQDFFPVAHPVTTGGVDHSDRLIALGPDSCVYQLNNGRCWPDIDSFIQYDWDQRPAWLTGNAGVSTSCARPCTDRWRGYKEFATLNGWRHTERMFSTKTLARGGTQAAPGEIPGYLDPHELLDHCLYFRELRQPYRPVAIVAQPYDVSVEKATEIAHSLGLDLHVPPNPVASWWYPGWARFFCLTRPGVVVRFLPDQLAFEKRSPRDSDAGRAMAAASVNQDEESPS